MKYSPALSSDIEIKNTLRRLRPELQKKIREESQLLSPIATGMRPRLNLMEGVRAVLFDIYGTLLISSSGEVGSARFGETSRAKPTGRLGGEGAAGDLFFYRTLSSEGLLIDRDPHSFEEEAEEAYKRLIFEEHERKKKLGLKHPEVDILSLWHRLLTGLLKRGTLSEPVPPCLPEIGARSGKNSMPDPSLLIRLSLAYELAVNRVWPMPGAAEVLEDLRSRGILMGIVSNAQFYTALILETLFGKDLAGLGFLEELCEWSYLGGIAKPSTDMFTGVLGALAKRGIDPDEVLYVGNDILNDVYAAGAVGCRTCLFAGDARSLRLRKENPELHSCTPDAIITHLSQLPGLLVSGPKELL
jgi:putative hydrolase of the HAD superfamily